MAAAAVSAALALIPDSSLALDCSCSVPNLLVRRGSKFRSYSRASSLSRVLRTEARSESTIEPIRGDLKPIKVPSSLSLSDGEESLRSPNAVLVSRRWAALVLPAVATLGSITLPTNRGAMAAENVGNERSHGVENGEFSGGRVELRTLNGCGLGVARFPDFVYNADGGGGKGEAQEMADGRTRVLFDADKLYIPAVSFDTTTILGLPIPPGLKIEVVPKTLEGYVERSTGKVELNFLANFYFTAGSLYSAPPLVVDTKLTTESAQGVFRGGMGQRLDSSGNVKLVGVARLAPVNDLFLSTFLTLPTDCLAELSANVSFPESDFRNEERRGWR